jgi:hypothetical protein
MMSKVARFSELKYGTNVTTQWPWAFAQLITCVPQRMFQKRTSRISTDLIHRGNVVYSVINTLVH